MQTVIFEVKAAGGTFKGYVEDEKCYIEASKDYAVTSSGCLRRNEVFEVESMDKLLKNKEILLADNN